MRLFAIAAVLVVFGPVIQAQSTQPRELAVGKLLVASRELGDPNFAESVVLLVHYDEKSVVGLIINRRTRLPLTRVFQDRKEANSRSDTVYSGGPVGLSGVLALLRTAEHPEDSEHVFGDVYLVANKSLLEKTLAAGTDAAKFHVYMGYAGWTVPQLEREVELGAWYIFRGDAALVFDADPKSVWSRLIRRTEDRIARITAAGFGTGSAAR
jgi:putative transcriptional regulator